MPDITTSTDIDAFMQAANNAAARISLGAGDASGPASSTDTAIALFNGAGGKTLQNSVVTIDPVTGDMDNVGELSAATAVVGSLTGRLTPRVTTITSSGTPTYSTDTADVLSITAQAAAITSFVTNLTGSPQPFDQFEFSILDNGTPRALTWATPFVGGPVAYPSTTVTSKTLHVYVERNAANTAWLCMATSSDL